MAEWLKASDCKSDDTFYVGSNPAPPRYILRRFESCSNWDKSGALGIRYISEDFIKSI
jgi:hypothetical protein